jgi:hypothetical protein
MKTTMKSIYAFIFIVVFVPLFLSNQQVVHAAYSGSGTGVEGDPYQITTCSQIIEINNELAAKYLVMNDLDCSSNGIDIIVGDSSTAFTGTFDGGGHTINININRQDSASYIGLFAYVFGGTVKNLAITGTINTNSSYVGSVAGATVGTTLITKVSNYANITGSGGIGGIVGLMNGGNITNVHNAGNITANAGYFVGGIVGNIVSGVSVSNSYNRGIISGSYHVGGIFGQRNVQATEITNNFNVGKVLSSQTTFFWGGIWGNDVWSDNSVLASGYTNNYFDVSRSTRTQCGYDNGGHPILSINGQCQGVNTAWADQNYFKNNNTNEPLASWDFSSTWAIIENGYPALTVLGQTDNISVNDIPTAPSIPRNISATVTASMISLYWDEPSDDGMLSRTGYIVKYKESDSDEWHEWTATPTQTLWNFTDLTEATQYDISLAAMNSFGTGPAYSGSVTTATKPGIPTSLVVTQNATNRLNVDLSWTAPNPGTTPISKYYISLKKSSDAWDNAIDVYNTESNVTSYNNMDWNLQYETSYDFRVQAYNSFDYGGTSEIFTYITPSSNVNHISSCQQLQDLNAQFDDNSSLGYEKYLLDQDIDCSETESWNEGRGFLPIYFFGGIFDGQNHTIKNLHINNEDYAGVGIFRNLVNATVKNLKIDNANIIGYYNVGILSGFIAEGTTVTISNVEITNAHLEGYSSVGGLTSEVQSEALLNIDNYTFSGSGFTNESLGAVAGLVDSLAAVDISNSNVSVDFQGDGDDSYGFGGYVGYSYGTSDIFNATASGTISADAGIGGFVGYMDDGNSGIAVATSAVDLTGYGEIGGFVGYNKDQVDIEYANSTGNIVAEEYRAGGLIGYSYSANINHCSNSGSVEGKYRIGGLVGSGEGLSIIGSNNSGDIRAVYSGSDTFFDQKGVGGLIGIAWNVDIFDSYNTGVVSGTGTLYVGGLIGASSDLQITRSYNSGVISGNISYHDYNGVGGLVGASVGSVIDNSYNEGAIEGKVSVGGIIGYGFSIDISNSYNSGHLTSSDYEAVGGLVGSNFAIAYFGTNSGLTIRNSFNTGELAVMPPVSVNADGDGAVIGVFGTESLVTLTNNWWNNTMGNGIGMNNYINPFEVNPETTDNSTNIAVDDEVVGQYQKAESKYEFIGNDINSPHNVWDFTTTWHTLDDKYPIHIYTLDAQLPVVTILGDNPVHVNQYTTYTDAGATAIDNNSGDLTGGMYIMNTVNTDIPSTYFVIYMAMDNSGNLGKQIRTVFVDSVGQTPTPTTSVVPTTVVPTTRPTSTPRPTYRIYPTATIMPTETLTPTITPTNITIVLNNYPEFLDGSGKLTTDLYVGQVIKFYINQILHKATITSISGNTVTVTFSSETINVTFDTGETKTVDVNGDGKDEIRVTLKGVVDGKADLIFAEILGESINLTVTPTISTAPSNTTVNFNNLWICVIGLLFLSVTVFIYINKRKAK